MATKFHVYDVNNLAKRRDCDGNSALHLAEVPEVADFLIHSLGMDDVNVQNMHGDTPLMMAAGLGVDSLPLVKCLCRHHADIDLENKKGETALRLARRWFKKHRTGPWQGVGPLVEFLLKGGFFNTIHSTIVRLDSEIR